MVATDSGSFGFEINATDQQWLRLEVWDIATNGAFTEAMSLDSGEDVEHVPKSSVSSAAVRTGKLACCVMFG